MNTRKFPLTAAVLFFILVPLTAWADILHLKNGRKITVEKAWRDSDQIWFILQGLKASIPQSKVARIDSGTKDPQKSGAPENRTRSEKKQDNPQPAEDMQPNQKKQTAEALSAGQSQPRPTDKALVLRKDGFNDLRWGVRLTDLKGLEKRPNDSGLDDVTEYERPADVLKIGNAELAAVIYAFWKDQLYTVTIWTQGLINYKALREAVFSQFGNGTQIEGAGERYLWSDGLTDAMLKYESDDQYGLLWMRSSELDRKVKLAKLSSPTSYLKWMKSRK
jgi:hypothetical protein